MPLSSIHDLKSLLAQQQLHNEKLQQQIDKAQKIIKTKAPVKERKKANTSKSE